MKNWLKIEIGIVIIFLIIAFLEFLVFIWPGAGDISMAFLPFIIIINLPGVIFLSILNSANILSLNNNPIQYSLASIVSLIFYVILVGLISLLVEKSKGGKKKK